MKTEPVESRTVVMRSSTWEAIEEAASELSVPLNTAIEIMLLEQHVQYRQASTLERHRAGGEV